MTKRTKANDAETFMDKNWLICQMYPQLQARTTYLYDQRSHSHLQERQNDDQYDECQGKAHTPVRAPMSDTGESLSECFIDRVD